MSEEDVGERCWEHLARLLEIFLKNPGSGQLLWEDARKTLSICSTYDVEHIEGVTE